MGLPSESRAIARPSPEKMTTPVISVAASRPQSSLARSYFAWQFPLVDCYDPARLRLARILPELIYSPGFMISAASDVLACRATSRVSENYMVKRRFDATKSGSEQPQRQSTTYRIPFIASLVVAAVGLVAFSACNMGSRRTLAADKTSQKKPSSETEEREVEEMIRRYFRTWSTQDMKGYGECFLNNSCVQYVDSRGRIELYQLPKFLSMQRDVTKAGQNAVETPESIEIRFEANLARVVVYWKLTMKSKESFGYDHFTLMKSNGKWGIVNLVFYEVEPN
jgi:hypothetical protein